MKSFPLRFTSIMRPMIYLFLFSLGYGVGELYLIQLSTSWNTFLECVWLALFGVGLYFVCTLIWGKKHKTLAVSKVLEVLGLCLILNLFTAYCISPLSLVNGPLVLLGAILGTFCLLFALPTLILFFKTIYEDQMNFKVQCQLVLKVWKSKFWIILNLWLLLFALMYGWDNLLGGPLYSATRFDAPSLFTSLLFLKEPTLYLEMIVYFSSGAQGTYELMMLGLMEAVIGVFLECNILSWYSQAYNASCVLTHEDLKLDN